MVQKTKRMKLYLSWDCYLFTQTPTCFLPHCRQVTIQFSSVQLLSCVQIFATQWTAARQASLSITSSQSLLELMSIESVMPSSVILLSSCFESFPASGSFPVSQFFTSGGQSIGASTSTSVLPMSIQGLISFRIDWLDLLAVEGTLKSLLQHHSSKASVLQLLSVFMVQLSHPYMTTAKAIALTTQTFVGKVIFLLSNVLSGLVMAFLPRSKCLLISWL